ncbi:MAG TPA: hypothetical protein VFL97_09365 [Nitrococcus sp.]|nr:hypothetical protein [Nitrococcus sp.]
MAEKDTSWKLSGAAEIIFYSLIILSLIGAVLAQISVGMGHTFWLVMVPVIGAATIYIEWDKVRHGRVEWFALIRTQILHWGSLLVADELVSLLAYFGRINNTAVSSMSLLLLAQTTFLVGIHRDWRFCVVAIFQVFCLIVLTYLETYIWLVLIVAIAIIVFGIYFHRKFPHLFSARHQG